MAEQNRPVRNPFANYAPSVRGKIVGMARAGMDEHAIRREIGCNIKTVRLWIQRDREGNDLSDHRKNNRRPKKTIAEQDGQLVEVLQENPFMSVGEALTYTNLELSARSGLRRLKNAGITAHRPAKTIPVTDEHREQRLRFAEEHLNWEPEQWGAVIWSDEKVFKSSDDGRRIVYRPRGRRQKMNPRFTVQKHTSGRITCGFWGCMSASGVMALHEISPHMNSEEYVDILEEVMLPCAREKFPEADYPVITFMQDNSAVHTSRATMAWFEEHPEVELMNWPSKSPDLNPIENLWSVMVREWRSGADRNRDDLIAHVNAVWDRMRERQDFTLKLVNSLPNRMRCVIENNGFPIDY